MPRRHLSSSKPGLHSPDRAGVVHTSPFRAKHPGTCFGLPRRGAMGEAVGLPRDGARTRLQAPNLGAVALSARSRTESRAPLRARERPRPSPAPRPGPPASYPAARTPDPPRPPAAASGGRSAGERRAGLCGAASPPCRGRDGGARREREKARPTGWPRAACNRWEAGPAGAGARAVSPRIPGGERGRPGGGGSELAGGGLSPAPACPARSEDAGGRCPGPGTRSVTRRCSCWPSSVPAGPWSTTAARISSTTCGTAPDPGSATQVSAAAAARRDPRALGWELGPRQGLKQGSEADWREEGG